jgi:hypothetical protein
MLEAAPARCTAAEPVTARQLTTPTTTAFLPARGVTSFGALGSRTTSRSTGEVVRELAVQFLSLAEKQGATIPLVVGHRLMGVSLAWTGDIAEGRAHYDQGVVLYDPAVHRPLATRFGQDAGMSILRHRSMALWLLGYPDAALADAKQALQEARDIGQATTLMFALFFTSVTQIFCGNHATATKEHDELIALADEKGSLTWKALCTPMQGCLFALTGKASLKSGQKLSLCNILRAIGGERRAGNQAGIVGGEKYGAAPDLFRFAEAADRNRRQDTILKNVFRHRLHHFGVDVTRERSH